MGATAVVQGPEPDTRHRPQTPFRKSRGRVGSFPRSSKQQPQTFWCVTPSPLLSLLHSSRFPLPGALLTDATTTQAMGQACPFPWALGGDFLGSRQGEVSWEEPSLVLQLGPLRLSTAEPLRGCVSWGKLTSLSLFLFICKLSLACSGLVL